jgi:hypothetical protein
MSVTERQLQVRRSEGYSLCESSKRLLLLILPLMSRSARWMDPGDILSNPE